MDSWARHRNPAASSRADSRQLQVDLSDTPSKHRTTAGLPTTLIKCRDVGTRLRAFMLLMAFALVGCEGAEEAVTILELPPRLTRTCSVSSPTTVIADTMVQGFSLNAGDSGVAVFTSRYDDTVSLSRL